MMKRPLGKITEHSVESLAADFPVLFMEYPAVRGWHIVAGGNAQVNDHE